MNDVRSASDDTSNDVLFRLEAMHLTDDGLYSMDFPATMPSSALQLQQRSKC